MGCFLTKNCCCRVRSGRINNEAATDSQPHPALGEPQQHSWKPKENWSLLVNETNEKITIWRMNRAVRVRVICSIPAHASDYFEFPNDSQCGTFVRMEVLWGERLTGQTIDLDAPFERIVFRAPQGKLTIAKEEEEANFNVHGKPDRLKE